jgi:hypothetical protein
LVSVSGELMVNLPAVIRHCHGVHRSYGLGGGGEKTRIGEARCSHGIVLKVSCLFDSIYYILAQVIHEQWVALIRENEGRKKREGVTLRFAKFPTKTK